MSDTRQDDALAALGQFGEGCQRRLETHFLRWSEQVPRARGVARPGELLEAVSDLTLRGGKRVRPALAVWAAECVGHELDAEILLDASLSLELLHTALLIHDDVMDRDDVRRGGPTVHAAMTHKTGELRLGDSLAILAGDLALALSQVLLAEAGLPASIHAPAAAELGRIQIQVIHGQHLDLYGGTPPELLQDLKTTSYTTRGPVRMGALFAVARPEQVAALEAYATPLGRAFQTRDDLLGTFGDATRLGKPVGADLRAGKRTELIALALERANPAERVTIERALGRPHVRPAELEAACQAIENTGARSELECLVDRLTAQAVEALSGAPLSPTGVELLVGLANLLATRTR